MGFSSILKMENKDWRTSRGERLLIETVRLRTKLPYELYREVIGGFRRVVEELYPAKMEDYLESFPKRKLIFDIIKREVL